jgi:hypothetical protein
LDKNNLKRVKKNQFLQKTFKFGSVFLIKNIFLEIQNGRRIQYGTLFAKKNQVLLVVKPLDEMF